MPQITDFTNWTPEQILRYQENASIQQIADGNYVAAHGSYMAAQSNNNLALRLSGMVPPREETVSQLFPDSSAPDAPNIAPIVSRVAKDNPDNRTTFQAMGNQSTASVTTGTNDTTISPNTPNHASTTTSGSKSKTSNGAFKTSTTAVAKKVRTPSPVQSEDSLDFSLTPSPKQADGGGNNNNESKVVASTASANATASADTTSANVASAASTKEDNDTTPTVTFTFACDGWPVASNQDEFNKLATTFFLTDWINPHTNKELPYEERITIGHRFHGFLFYSYGEVVWDKFFSGVDTKWVNDLYELLVVNSKYGTAVQGGDTGTMMAAIKDSLRNYAKTAFQIGNTVHYRNVQTQSLVRVTIKAIEEMGVSYLCNDGQHEAVVKTDALQPI